MLEENGTEDVFRWAGSIYAGSKLYIVTYHVECIVLIASLIKSRVFW